ncbi:unnamed protein product [Anisakis simplex]|uniref:Centaurin-gamma-1A (inferred by orthology to a D. melanogaster protein) n=1 Tax=Anisakis simplex TaxID=6269 RepID=A0A0M3KB05_ANISI|nr:unnamed protein product [Anisakis simplex]
MITGCYTCQKIIQQRLRLLGGVVGSTRTPTPTAATHTNGATDHRNINYQEPSYATKTAAYHHQRSVSALPLQDHSQNFSRRIASQSQHTYQQPSPSPALKGHVYHRENSNLTAAARSSDRSLSAFAMPSAPALHAHKVQRASQYECNAAISPAHSANSVTSSTGGSLLQHPASRLSSSNVHASQLDQAAYVRDEIFDNHIPAQPASLQPTTSSSHLPTPSSTPTTQRRNRRISNLFQRPKDHNHDEKSHKTAIDLNMGMGRTIPVKQGHLYKRSSKTLNKEWKKKYVCLHSDGRLSYHQTLKDYMEKDTNGKEVFLGLATVRVAGRQRPRATQRAQTQPITVPRDIMQSSSKESANATKRESLDPISTRRTNALVTAYEFLGQDTASSRGTSAGQTTPGEGTSGGSDDQQMSLGVQPSQQQYQLASSTSSSMVTSATPALTSNSAVKKKKSHRRLGSGVKNHEEGLFSFQTRQKQFSPIAFTNFHENFNPLV